MTRRRGWWLFFVTVILLGGCNRNAAKQPAEQAEASLDQFLNAWIRNEPSDKFAAGTSIRGTDLDWKAGQRLLSFLSVDSSPAADSPQHIRCRVALSLQSRNGQKSDKEVVYDVQLGDPIVIGRAKP